MVNGDENFTHSLHTRSLTFVHNLMFSLCFWCHLWASSFSWVCMKNSARSRWIVKRKLISGWDDSKLHITGLATKKKRANCEKNEALDVTSPKQRVTSTWERIKYTSLTIIKRIFIFLSLLLFHRILSTVNAYLLSYHRKKMEMNAAALCPLIFLCSKRWKAHAVEEQRCGRRHLEASYSSAAKRQYY